MTKEINCSHCNNILIRHEYRLNRSKFHFCNKECRESFEKYNTTSTRKKKIIIVNCEVCEGKLERTPFQVKTSKTGKFFCNKHCRSKWDSIKFNSLKVIKNCIICNKEMIGTNSRMEEQKYCSLNCIAKNKSINGTSSVTCNRCGIVFTKKNSMIYNSNFCSKKCSNEYTSEISKLNRPKLICVICNNIYEVLPSQSERSKTCSRTCRNEHLSILIKTDTEYIKAYKQRGITSYLSQSKSDTKPELMVKEWLIENNIDFEAQLLMHDKFIVDFYLPKYNQVLEVNGDYWHANPIKYGEGKKELNEHQLKQIKKDKARKNYLETCGYKFSIAWENDIYKDVNTLMEKLIIQNP